MTEKEPKYTVGDIAGEQPTPPVAAWPLTGDGHAIISGLLADRAERDALLLAQHALQDDLAAVRAELATAQQALAGWAAQEAVRTGGQRQSSAQRFAATLQAWRRQVPYAQQARIIAELLAAEEGQGDARS